MHQVTDPSYESFPGWSFSINIFLQAYNQSIQAERVKLFCDWRSNPFFLLLDNKISNVH